MEDVPDGQPMIEIQVVGWTWNVPWIRVFIDGERVGFLKDKSAWSFPVAAGVCKVKVASYRKRSETLHLSMSPGDRAVLECGYHKGQISGLQVMTLVLMATSLVTMQLRLHLTGWAAMGLALVGVVIQMWRAFKPGSHLYLRPRTAPTVAGTETLPVMPRPRITIRQGMVVVAVAALLLAAAAQERRMQRQFQYQLQARSHRRVAEYHAERELFTQDVDKKVVSLQEAWIEYLKRKREDQADAIAELQRWRVDSARLAAYHAQLKEKYLYAADHPWEPMEDDPPYPE